MRTERALLYDMAAGAGALQVVGDYAACLAEVCSHT